MQSALNLPNPLAARQSLFLSTDGQPFTTSRAIAERFGKQHDNVVRDIKKLLAQIPDPAFSLLNFEESNYQNHRGKSYPEYRLTHDGFAFLAMRFTGTDAMAWQIAFLQAFNAMETELHARTARFAHALDQVRPSLRTAVQDAEAGLPRAATAARLGKSHRAVTYHRRSARRLGLLGAAS